MDQVMIDLVKEEAAKLKEAATQEEIAKLNIETLFENSTERCIYGQMTDDCHSDRAVELILNCCHRVYTAQEEGGNGSIQQAKLNGEPTPEIIYADYRPNIGYRRREHYSPIEVFLYHATQQQKESLVSYLKGEVETLDI